MKRVSRILLIDDSESDNFIHTRRLTKMGVAGEVVTKTNGQEALDYIGGKGGLPELIFLDINMPVMDGWTFLDNLRIIDSDRRKGTVVVAMLTSSLTNNDENRAESYDDVIDEKGSKPLTVKFVEGLMEKYYG